MQYSAKCTPQSIFGGCCCVTNPDTALPALTARFRKRAIISSSLITTLPLSALLPHSRGNNSRLADGAAVCCLPSRRICFSLTRFSLISLFFPHAARCRVVRAPSPAPSAAARRLSPSRSPSSPTPTPSSTSAAANAATRWLRFVHMCRFVRRGRGRGEGGRCQSWKGRRLGGHACYRRTAAVLLCFPFFSRVVTNGVI